jgi:hypothetical protein
VERSGPCGGSRILTLRDFDQLQPAEPQTPEPESEKLSQDQVTGADQSRGHHRVQIVSGKSLSRPLDRHVVKDRLSERAFEGIGDVESRYDVALSVAKRVKPPAALAGIELRRTETNVMAPDKRAVRLPGEEERIER